MTLVILAAGMGSRFGGLKQLEPITDNGEFIIDLSIFDACRAGFDKVVFIIKKENYGLFRETVGARVEPHVRVQYVFQELENIPEGASVPSGRKKPWGTAHALLCAKDAVAKDSFAVINADDFYGREAFEVLANHLREIKSDGEFCMAGFTLRHTLTENGTVSRGVCRVDESGMLSDINERTRIRMCGEDAEYLDGQDWIYLDGDCSVSMNCWGLTPKIFDRLESAMVSFMADNTRDPLTKEIYLPFVIDEMMKAGECSVRVYPIHSRWFGVTYPDDKQYVRDGIAALTRSGEYPDGLWAEKN